MARPRKATKEKEPKLGLAAALDFIKLAQADKSNDLAAKTHCRLQGGYAVAFDGVLAMGHPIEEELAVCPHTYRLIDALSRCKKAMSVTQLDGEKLVIKSGNFRVVIPCLNPAAIPYAVPDPRAGDLTDELINGFAALNPVVTGNGQTVVESSLLVNNGSMVATDRMIMLEYWHGINLPDGLAIPKVAVAAVLKIRHKLVGVGVSDRTVTFHYENGAWLRTQLYAEPWPDVYSVLNRGDPHTATELPEAFFDAVDAVAPFNEGGSIYTTDSGLASHHTEGAGATYAVGGVPAGLSFTAKYLQMMKGYAKRVDLVGSNGISFFYGDRVRGAIAQRRG